MRAGAAMKAAMAAVTLFAAACAPTPAPATGDPASPPAGSTAFGPPQYTCGRFPFEASVLDRVSDGERADSPAVAALREYLAAPTTDRTLLPDHGWTLVGVDAAGAELVAPGADPSVPLVSVVVTQDRGTWKVTDGGECQARRILPPGLNMAHWILRREDKVQLGMTAFQALVIEQVCASGEPADGRILAPEIRALPGQVVVTFATRPLQDGLTHTCQESPVTHVDVTLPEPLGSRKLVDGSTFPFRDPVQPECCGLQSSGARG